MKKKTKVSGIIKICVLITSVILASSFLLFLLTNATDNPGDQLATQSPAISQPQTNIEPTISQNSQLKVNKDDISLKKELALPVIEKPKPVQTKGDKIHFIHIPKCGGTTMTTLLRQIQCTADPEGNSDCCLNPGFCDWHAHRRCSTIMGCINHFPNRKLIYKPMKSIAVVRDPISRLLSAWFYRGHSPNNDFFQVRPEFKDIRDGKLPKVTFQEYLEMHEYQNIQTRMLGADSFPYRNITVTEEVYQKAEDALKHLFFVGLQEEFQISSELLIREMAMSDKLPTPEIKKERDQSTGKTAQQKTEIKSNASLMKRAREVNQYDIRLFKKAEGMFCATLKKYPDLEERVRVSGKVNCESIDYIM